MTEFEIKKLQDYLNNKFQTDKFIAKKRKKKIGLFKNKMVINNFFIFTNNF